MTGLMLTLVCFLMGLSKASSIGTVAVLFLTLPSAASTTGISPVGAVELSLHYNPQFYDPRPRVKVSFLSYGQDIGYSLLFDTGSEEIHIFRASGSDEEVAALADASLSYVPQYDEPVSRPAKWTEGYLDSGNGIRVNRILTYGSPGSEHYVGIYSLIQEEAMLFSGQNRFSLPTVIGLSNTIRDDLGIGLLGAGPGSSFADEAGAFAYIGPAVDLDSTAGRLVIGERDSWDTFCAGEGRVSFFPKIVEMGYDIYWVVQGSISFNGSESSTLFVIDTGAAYSFVTSEVLNLVRAEMMARGAQVVQPLSSRTFEEYKNCPASSDLPIVTFKLGEGPDSVNVPLQPEEYINYSEDDGNCHLQLSDQAATDNGGRIIGVSVLSKIMTVFDLRNDRVGFCITRS